MYGPTFPIPTTDVMATLVEMFRCQSEDDLVRILESASAQFKEGEYDNWNGGTQYWTLELELPVPLFAQISAKKERIEGQVRAMVDHIGTRFPNDPISCVNIIPMIVGSEPRGQSIAPAHRDVQRLWADGRFRLFLSHVSQHKKDAYALKDALRLCGIDCFVAHEDIKPSREWQLEIELALRSMHALGAMLTTSFHQSDWTDQEIGWALGRGVLVLPIRCGLDPYGFVGKIHGLRGDLTDPSRLAIDVAETLLTNVRTNGDMRRAIISTIESESSRDALDALTSLVAKIPDVSSEERKRLWQASSENKSLIANPDILSCLHSAIGTPPWVEPEIVEDSIPF